MLLFLRELRDAQTMTYKEWTHKYWNELTEEQDQQIIDVFNEQDRKRVEQQILDMTEKDE